MLNVAWVRSLVDWKLSHIEVQAWLLDFHNKKPTNPILCRYTYIVTKCKLNCWNLVYEKVLRFGVQNSRDHFAMSQFLCIFSTVTFTSELRVKRHSLSWAVHLSCHFVICLLEIISIELKHKEYINWANCKTEHEQTTRSNSSCWMFTVRVLFVLNVQGENVVCVECSRWECCLCGMFKVRMLFVLNVQGENVVCVERPRWECCLCWTFRVRMLFVWNVQGENVVCVECSR